MNCGRCGMTAATRFLQVRAKVRYWEDATFNDVEDIMGTLVPFRYGDMWCPVIDLRDGKVDGWPVGTTARIHYKVCDEGEYWLLDDARDQVAKWKGHYVPDDFLCHGDEGFGDYIIFDVSADGSIIGWSEPRIDPDDWASLRGAPAAPDDKDV